MTALLIVDVQRDFFDGGVLPVPDAKAILPEIDSRLTDFDVIVATRLWYPKNHGCFAASHPGKAEGDHITLYGLPQTLKPVHCVQNSDGAAFHPLLDETPIMRIFARGADPTLDGYSAFYDAGQKRATGLAAWLRAADVNEIVLAGLTTEGCIAATVLDATRLGFAVTVMSEACRGFRRDHGAAMHEFEQKGAKII